MTIDEIKELIRVVNDTGIAELEVTRGDDRVRIRRSDAVVQQEYAASGAAAGSQAQMQVSAAAGSTGSSAAPVQQASSAQEPAASVPDENTIYVKSPIVGTYYESASPGSPAFVKVGDRVSPGQVLCIIESMKLMNEIEAEVSGIILSKLVENGRPVEYGEALFAIQP